MPTPTANSPIGGLDIIYETEDLEQQQIEKKAALKAAKMSSNSNTLATTDFKENMLLSFYNWPKVESSSVIQDPIEPKKNTTIQVPPNKARYNMSSCRQSLQQMETKYMIHIEEEKEAAAATHFKQDVDEENTIQSDYENAQFHTVDSEKKKENKMNGHKSSLPELPF